MSEPVSKRAKASRRVGIVGFGKVGNFLAKNVIEQGAEKGVELAWVSSAKAGCFVVPQHPFTAPTLRIFPQNSRNGVDCYSRTASYIIQVVYILFLFLSPFSKVVDLFAPQNVTACDFLTADMKRDPSSLDACLARRDVDFVVEVAHPDITKDYGVKILQQCDYLMASTTTFADPDTESTLLAEAANPTGNGVYITPGEFEKRPAYMYAMPSIRRRSTHLPTHLPTF